MTSIPLLVAVGVWRDGQKVLLAVKNMGGETEAAWRHVLEDPLVNVLLLIACAINPSRRQRGTQVLRWAAARAIIAAHIGCGGYG